MNQSDAPQNQPLVEYQIDRVVDETSTETRIVVLSRKGGDPDAFPIWIGAAEGTPSSWPWTPPSPRAR